MTTFFFYKNLCNIELIRKINEIFEIHDGYINIENYDMENNILQINNYSLNNNKLLYGKIVKFNMNVVDIIEKIKNIKECHYKNDKYILDNIIAYKDNKEIYKSYIIY